jgi:hypothetical protein
MKKIWDRLSVLSKYYFTSMISFFLCWGILTLIGLDFLNTLLFILAFIWHFTLLTPGLKEKVIISKQRFSFLSVVVRINYYLQLFIKIDKFRFGPSIIRAISPVLFVLLLKVAGGNGNVLFALLGSVSFEFFYRLIIKKSISAQPSDLETPPMIPSEEIYPESIQNPHSHQTDFEKKI